MHQLPELGNFDICHLESLCGFDIKRPGNKYGHRGEIVQRGNRHLDNLNFCVTPSTQVPRASQNLPASAVAEIS